MEIQSLEQMLDTVECMVHDQMGETGQILPFLFCQKQGGETVIIGYNAKPTVTQRRIQALLIGNELRELDVVTYVVAHEVWMNSAPTAEAVRALPPPSKCSDRTEAVMIQAHNIAASQTRIFKIDRPDGKPKLTDISEDGDQTHPGGTWDNLLMDPSAVH